VFKPADLGYLNISSTMELKPYDGVIEQPRPRNALELGIRVRQRNFHIFVAGPTATGKMTTTMRLLRRDAPKRNIPPDIMYIHNFEVQECPLVVELPAGQGIVFRNEMEVFIEALRHDVPDAYHSKEHQGSIQAVLNSSMERENEALAELKDQASNLSFLVRTSKQGLTVLPVVDGKPLSQKEYTDLNASARKTIEARRKKLDPMLSAFFEFNREIEIQSHAELEELQRQMALSVIESRLSGMVEKHRDHPAIQEYLNGLVNDILLHLERFIPEEEEKALTPEAFLKTVPQYRINLVVDNRKTRGAPVIIEDRPNYYNLFGRIEKHVEFGIYSTDHTMLKAGSLLRANGGFLVLNAADLLAQPGVWELMKSTLRTGQIRIEDLGEASGFLATSGLRPTPVNIDVKILLIGSHSVYEALYRYDEDFPKLFRIKAEFDDSVDWDRTAERAYARFVAGVCEKDELLPIDVTGLNALIETGARWADHQRKLSLSFNSLASLVIEADDVARRRRSKIIRRDDIHSALERREYQVSHLRDRMFDDLAKNFVLISVEGDEVGTINGLTVLQDGPFDFGKPARITARAQAGTEGILNVEREAHLSGQIHDKAVLILAGFLGGKYGTRIPISASISICFEQSYGYVDGDSASLGELLAILSELSGLAIRQDLAVTGSINQLGQVQPVGGVTSKIEGFHRLCQIRGLTGTQGVVVPRANIRDLMLHKSIREDIEAGRFHIYAVQTVDEAIMLFFNQTPGTLRNDVFTPARSIHNQVFEQLKKLHELNTSTGSPTGTISTR